MTDTCKNCGETKPRDRFKCCPTCRLEWRMNKRKASHTPEAKMRRALEVIQLTKDVEKIQIIARDVLRETA